MAELLLLLLLLEGVLAAEAPSDRPRRVAPPATIVCSSAHIMVERRAGAAEHARNVEGVRGVVVAFASPAVGSNTPSPNAAGADGCVGNGANVGGTLCAPAAGAGGVCDGRSCEVSVVVIVAEHIIGPINVHPVRVIEAKGRKEARCELLRGNLNDLNSIGEASEVDGAER